MTRKAKTHIHMVLLLGVVLSTPLRAIDILVEAEAFEEPGGWLVDPQFMDIMGSSYLLAHGLGTPVKNARTQYPFTQGGIYHVWIRSKDWVPSYHPGRFKVAINGHALPVEFGASAKNWTWESGGPVEIDKGLVTIELEDLTGFDGRCDAIFFTTDSDNRPPMEANEQMQAWRRTLRGLPKEPPKSEAFDLVVVGGGVAGCSATLAASRLGLKVAFIQNRPMLGGNGSSEIGITTRGQLSELVSELVRRGPDGAIQAESVLRAEKNVTLYLGWHVYGARKEGHTILSVDARHIATGQERRFPARMFVDTTGVGAVGFLAGAEFRLGREAANEFNESLAPKEADQMHHGNTIVFRTAFTKASSRFPPVPWALKVAGDYDNLGGQIAAPGKDNRSGPGAHPHRQGDQLTHYWEYGQWLDPIADAERIRDHLLCAIYGTFANAKRQEKNARLVLDYVGHVPAGGEARRLVGDYILTENDIRSGGRFKDIAAINTGHFCLHYPGKAYDFRLGDWKWVEVKPYGIPFRCLYSRNIENLMMAGKHISVSHVAGSSTKTMLNGGQHGVAVGAAAYLCIKHNSSPRGVGKDRMSELQNIISGFSPF